MTHEFYPCESTHLALRDQFLLDPSVTYLTHGTYGACPRPVLDEYQRWQRELEGDPLAFLSFVAWIIYAGTLAGRAAGGWHGRRAAYFSIIGFAMLVATLGAGLFLPGRHGS